MELAALPQPGTPLTMSSRDIAELTGSTHDNVLKTIRRLVTEGVVSANETPYRHPQNGQTYLEFLLSFRDTMVVVSGYSAELRARIVDRWQALELAAAPSPLNLRDIRQLAPLALQLVQVVQEQQAELEAARPKVEFFDRVSDASNAQTVEEIGKLFGLSRVRMFAELRRQGLLLRNNLPAQEHLTAGRFRVIERVYKDASGQEHAYAKTLVTGLGLTYIAKRLGRALEVAHG